MTLTRLESVTFDQRYLRDFRQRNAVETQFVPALESTTEHLELYQQLLSKHSTRPDLLHIDVIWPGILGDDLVDLKAVVGREAEKFAPAVMETYTLGGKLLAIPSQLDVGVLYYRPDLLRRYGFQHAPATWDELERMAATIQRGERKAGNKDFWGFSFQGGRYEGLTCNAMEWQSAAGAGLFVGRNGTINVRNRRFIAALQRARGWIGTIAPPGQVVYDEFDPINLWNAGQVAFMRNWTSMYSMLTPRTGRDVGHFGVALLPGGPGGSHSTLGGWGMGVSKYGLHRELAILALREITSEDHDLQRIREAPGIPTHATVAQRTDIEDRFLSPAVWRELMAGLIARPSMVTGKKYGQVSRAYFESVNQVLRGEAQAEPAMEDLEKKLVQITGFSVEPQP